MGLLQAKLRAFLELRTADGPRHDTYVVFYSGHTHRSGEWALAGEQGSPRSPRETALISRAPLLILVPPSKRSEFPGGSELLLGGKCLKCFEHSLQSEFKVL